ncbi:retention module-containing protein, partial [Rheinheimera baltica]|uniref:retention module-containing protein n=1 Tax=Rheinheimera baltica TaxID=67576 RepID=UPI0004827C50
MSEIIAQVVEGTVKVQSVNGEIRVLKQGDALLPGDIIITADDSAVVLAYLNETVSIASNQQIVISDSWLQADVSATDSAVNVTSADDILAVLDAEGDLLAELEATAAGGAGTGENSGNSFVRLTRIAESNDPSLLLPGSFSAAEGPAADADLFGAVQPVNEPVDILVNSITEDNIINASEAAGTVTVSGTATGGDIAPGDLVTIVINGVTYTTIVQADGTWSVDVAGSDLAAGPSFDVVVTSTNLIGNSVTSSVTSTHGVDVTADAGTVLIDNITADNILNAIEAGSTITVTGSAVGGDIAPGDVVTMVINGTTYTTTVQADGTWSVDVAGSDLAADTSFDVVVTSTDASGNTVDSTGTSTHTLDTEAEAGTVNIDNITADDILNASEAAGTVVVTGSAVGGDIAPGDVVTMVINGTTYTTTVQADGTWSVDVAGSDLAADTSFDVVVTSTDSSGNTVDSTGTSTHTLDTEAEAGTVNIDNITAD